VTAIERLAAAHPVSVGRFLLEAHGDHRARPSAGRPHLRAGLRCERFRLAL
jgi:hypothetical protein